PEAIEVRNGILAEIPPELAEVEEKLQGFAVTAFLEQEPGLAATGIARIESIRLIEIDRQVAAAPLEGRQDLGPTGSGPKAVEDRLAQRDMASDGFKVR